MMRPTRRQFLSAAGIVASTGAMCATPWRVLAQTGVRPAPNMPKPSFIETNGIYPNGQHVELFDGRVAVVREQSDDMLRPKVALYEADGTYDALDPLDPGPATLIDLREIECGCARAVGRVSPAPASRPA